MKRSRTLFFICFLGLAPAVYSQDPPGFFAASYQGAAWVARTACIAAFQVLWRWDRWVHGYSRLPQPPR